MAIVAAVLLAGPASCALAVQSDDGDDEALLADADYAAGRSALAAGHWAAALDRFQAALKRFPEAADLHNELGFAYRKLRRMDKAFQHYERALTLKPAHRGAHEYIGEAYLMVDDAPAAERHLAALRSICLLPCQEQKELEQAIAAYKASKKPPS